MKTRLIRTATIVTVLLMATTILNAQTPAGTAFTYQGQLKLLGTPLNDTADFEFLLWDAAEDGNPVSSLWLQYGMHVDGGLFTVPLNFGSAVFDGEARWLEIAVRTPAGSGSFTILSPRQELMPVPYALYALNSPGGSGYWAASGDDIYYDAGKVGIGWAGAAFPLDVRSSGSTALYAYNSASGQAIVASSAAGTAIVANSSSGSGDKRVVDAAIANPDGFALYGLNEAEEGAACAVYGETLSPVGFGGYFVGRGYFSGNVGIGTSSPSHPLHVQSSGTSAIDVSITSTSGSTRGVRSQIDSPGGVAVDGIANAATGTAAAVRGGSQSPDGVGVLGYNDAGSGNAIGVRGETGSDTGFGGYFLGRGYFSDRVGIGVTNPQTTLHLGGESGVDGIIFPDGTQQNTAAVGGGGDSLWSEADNDIYYTAGNVGIGTSSPTERLHVADDAQIDGNLGIGTAPAINAAIDVLADSNYFGIRVQRTAAADGAAISATATTTSGSADGVRGTTYAAGGSGVSGTGEIGVKGWNNTETGMGVTGTHYASTGDAPGVYGTTNSTSNLAAGVKGEAASTASGAFTVGVMGVSHSGLGTGVYGKADYSDPIIPTYGGIFISESTNGRGVVGEATGTGAFAGFFNGRGYFSGNVGIGTTTPVAKLDVAGTARVDVIQIDGGADLSEKFAVEGLSQPGMVVVIDPEHPGALRTSTSAYDRRVAGIISGAGGVQTGLLMSQEGSLADGEHPVALAGRVYCWCDASGGAIEPGDMLTTSDTPGHAMKVTDYPRAQGAIIGKAMTSLEEGSGLVLVLVNLQ